MKIQIDLSKDSTVIGRNGTYLIDELQVVHVEEGGFVLIDLRSMKSQTLLNAGMTIGVKDMDKLAQEWIKYRGDRNQMANSDLIPDLVYGVKLLSAWINNRPNGGDWELVEMADRLIAEVELNPEKA